MLKLLVCERKYFNKVYIAFCLPDISHKVLTETEVTINNSLKKRINNQSKFTAFNHLNALGIFNLMQIQPLIDETHFMTNVHPKDLHHKSMTSKVTRSKLDKRNHFFPCSK